MICAEKLRGKSARVYVVLSALLQYVFDCEEDGKMHCNSTFVNNPQFYGIKVLKISGPIRVLVSDVKL